MGGGPLFASTEDSSGKSCCLQQLVWWLVLVRRTCCETLTFKGGASTTRTVTILLSLDHITLLIRRSRPSGYVVTPYHHMRYFSVPALGEALTCACATLALALLLLVITTSYTITYTYQPNMPDLCCWCCTSGPCCMPIDSSEPKMYARRKTSQTRSASLQK